MANNRGGSKWIDWAVVATFVCFAVGPILAQDACPPDRFCYVQPNGAVAGDGTPTGIDILYRSDTTPDGPLFIKLEGGGACWDGDLCDCQPDQFRNCQNPFSGIARKMHFDVTNDSLNGKDLALTVYGGVVQCSREEAALCASDDGSTIAALAGPNSPFRSGWNLVHVPYVTGDAHGGNAVQTYTTTQRATNITYTVYHKGYSNMTAFLRRLKQDFPNPSKVVLYGESGGAVGADCNLKQVVDTWPDARLYEMSNAGAPLSAPQAPGIPGITQTWGEWHLVDGKAIADTCPIAPPDGRTYRGLRDVIRYNSLHFSGFVRMALTDDYSDATIQQFACLAGARVNPRTGACTTAIRQMLIKALTDDINSSNAPPNPRYKVYYHEGPCHAEREGDGNGNPDCDYDSMKQGAVMFNDWFRGWAEVPGYDWKNAR